MSGDRPVPPRRPPWQRALLAGAVTLLAVLLPAVLAMRGIAAPGSAAELARLQRAVAGSGPAAESGVALRFYASAVPHASWPDAADQQQALLVLARTSAVAAVLALAMLTYLLVLLARGRLQALLACGALGFVPAVAEHGHVLRAEAPAALFAALAVLLLQCLARQQPRRQRRAVLRLGGLVACAACASGLAVAASPHHGAPLLVAGVVLTLLALALAWRAAGVVRRHGWMRLPVRALNARLLPWTATALLAPAMALWLLQGECDSAAWLLPSTSASCWPAAPGLRALFVPLLVIGAVAMAVRAGQRWRRRGWPAADLVLLVYAALALAGGLSTAASGDGLPAAGPLAAILAEGALAPVVLLRRGRVTS